MLPHGLLDWFALSRHQHSARLARPFWTGSVAGSAAAGSRSGRPCRLRRTFPR